MPAGEFVLQNNMMTKEVFFRAAEYLPYAQRMLLITKHFACTPVPFKMLYDIWSTKPYNSKDSAGALRCAKTGLLVPVHAQAMYNGKVYDRKWVPQGPRQ
jgi:hypothetical protein